MNELSRICDTLLKPMRSFSLILLSKRSFLRRKHGIRVNEALIHLIDAHAATLIQVDSGSHHLESVMDLWRVISGVGRGCREGPVLFVRQLRHLLEPV